MKAPSASAIVRVHDLRVQRSGRDICHVREFAALPGERVGIVGPNGCGKTTMLRVLAGFETATSGSCRTDVGLHDCVFIHQAPKLFRGSVVDNVTYGLSARKVPRGRRRSLALEWLRRVGMEGYEDRDASTLSGGEARRVAIIRACILKPKLFLLDEPFADLDLAGIDSIHNALDVLTDSTILIASPTALPESLPHRLFAMTVDGERSSS